MIDTSTITREDVRLIRGVLGIPRRGLALLLGWPDRHLSKIESEPGELTPAQQKAVQDLMIGLPDFRHRVKRLNELWAVHGKTHVD